MHDVLHEILGNALHERAKHVVTLALPLGEWVFLTHRTQVDALLEVVHLFEMFTPALVDNAQHHLTFNFAHYCFAELLFTLFIEHSRIGHHDVVNVVG